MPISLYIKRATFKQDFLEGIRTIGVVMWLSVHLSICISLYNYSSCIVCFILLWLLNVKVLKIARMVNGTVMVSFTI